MAGLFEPEPASVVAGLPPRRPWSRVHQSLIAAAVTLSTVTAVVVVPSTAHAAPAGGVKAPTAAAVSVAVGTGVTKAAVRAQTDTAAVTRLDHSTLPGAGTANIGVSGAVSAVGGLPITLSATSQVDAEDASPQRLAKGEAVAAPVAGPATVRVEVVDQSLARKAQVAGVMLTLSRSDRIGAAGRVHLRVDYSSFANAYGADFGQRLRLVQLPACALSTPEVPACQQRQDLGAVNAGGTLSGDVTVAGDGAVSSTTTGAKAASETARPGFTPVVLALSGGSSSGGATFSATSLSPSYAWSAGNQGGTFTFGYPFRTPAAVGGPSPNLSLDYNSGSVDAKTLAENGQTSWAGEGWDLDSGFIERSYRPCTQDGGSTGDPCWFSSYNATMAFGGSSARLVRDNTTGVWHASSDSGMKIELLNDTSRGNGDNDGEYWRVTTMDGTQYYFGANKRYAGDPAATNSTQLQPVYGNNVGEPCYNATFASAWCQQAYRWNLDYVVDPRGNTMTYYYAKSSGYVGLNNNTNVQPYDYDATLDHIDYGTRSGSEGTGNAPAQVWFTRTGRCINTCQPNTSDYPDTPWDLYCSSSTSCPTVVSPVYWTQYKLSSVYTRVWDATLAGYRKVDQWDLGYTFPATGDNIAPAGDDTSPNLWLQSLTHTGYAIDGVTTLAEPALSFGGTGMFNRVDWGNDLGVSPYNHYRLSSIVNGSGGQTLVTYSTPQCDRTFVPNPEANPYRCFPEYFKPTLAPAGWGWFQKYVVTGVTDKDLTGGSPDEVWAYNYSTAGSSDPSLWHHDYSETVQLAYRSWSLWQGYSSVTVTHGPATGPQTVNTSVYFRGMDNDGMATVMNDGMVWGSRRVGMTTPVSLGGAAAISGTGGACLSLVGGGTADGTRLELRDCVGAASQVFQSTINFTLVNPGTAKCLATVGAGTANGTNVELRTCDGSGAQEWRRQPDGSMQNPQSGRCMEVNGASVANGSNVDIWDCPPGGFNAVWLPRADGTLVQPQERRCLDITGAATADGTAIENWACSPGAANQQWRLQTNGTLVNPASGKCVDITGSATANGSPIALSTCTAAANQLWTPQADGGLKNASSGRCLDATATPYNGTRPVLWDCNAGTAPSRSQKWVDFLVDADGTQGFEREGDRFDGTTLVGSSLHVPTATQTALRSAPVTGGQDIVAIRVSEGDGFTRTWLPLSSKYRWTELQTTYDSYGLPVDKHDLADMAVTTDDTCSHTDYARNVSGTSYFVSLVSQQVTTDCAATLGNSDYLGGSQVLYDGSATVGAAPTLGLPTTTKKLGSVSSGVFTWVQSARAGYDANGRATSNYDALDHLTGVAFTPATGGPVTAVTTTNPLNWTTTVTIEPGKGGITKMVDPNGMASNAQYDPLGRVTKAWLNNRSTSLTPDRQYTYTLSSSVPNSIQEQILSPSGSQISSYKIFDGRTRLRQTQEVAPQANGGRMIIDTAYDARGLVAKTSQFWNNASGPSSTLATFTDATVPTQRQYTYDKLERKTVDALYSLGTVQYQTTYLYQGDRSAEQAPAGGTTTQTIFDGRGNITTQKQFQNPNLTGSSQSTTYTYDRLNRMTKATDPAGNKWTRTFDLRGRMTSQTSPDTGTTTTTFDNLDEVLTTNDGRGVKLAYTYDALGRRTAMNLTSTSGALQASWLYDTLAKGQPTSSTSVVGTNNYTTAMTGYDSAYRPLGLAVTIPASEGGLSGTWTSTNTYNVDGSVASVSYPAAGGMAAETVNYTYDTAGFQLTAAGTSTYVSGATFQPWGDLYQQLLGASGKRVLVTTDEFAGSRRSKTIQVSTENQTTPGTYDEKLTQQYHWDTGGSINSIDSQHAGTTTDSQCFAYDYLGELTTAWTTTPAAGGCATAPSTASVGGTDPYWTSWSYDTKTGNRTGQTQHGLGGVADTVSTYTYPAAAAAKAHGLSGVTVVAPSGTTSNSYTYDGAGHTSNATIDTLSTDYTWTNDGHLASAIKHAVGGDQTTSYVYNTAGGILIRKTPTGNTLYLGGTEVTTNSAGVLTGATRYYVCNGATVASRNLSGVTFLAYDHEGTAQVAVTATTLATSIRRLDPFGQKRGTPPAWPNEHGFVGGTEEPTGLVSLGARMYDPTTGRFLSDDRVFNVGDPQGMNGYVYADNRPTSSSDASGYKAGSVGAHETAIMLRMAALRAAYPNAIIQGSIPSNQGGPDLVCWGCKPGEVWVWEFKSENDRAGDTNFDLEVLYHMAQAQQDPRTGTDAVVAGPTFASIGLPPIQVGANHANPDELVTVYDYAPGVQLYGVDDNNRRSRAGKLAVKTTDAAKAIAVDSNAAAKKEADAAKAAASAPTAQSGGSSSTNQRPPIYDDGVVPGSFFGDVVLFAGVIFTALVAIDLIVTGIAAALEAAAAYFAVEAVESAAAGVGAAVEAVGGAIVEGAEAVGEAASEVGSIGNVIINEGMNLLGKAVCFVFC